MTRHKRTALYFRLRGERVAPKEREPRERVTDFINKVPELEKILDRLAELEEEFMEFDRKLKQYMRDLDITFDRLKREKEEDW